MVDDGITPLSYLEKMEFSHLDEKDYSALAVSIGGFTYGATTLEMASGYATLANNGVFRSPNAITDLESEETQVYSPIAAYLTTDALSEVAKYGTASRLKPSVPISCKTGTTNNNKDAWLCGYTRDYTIAIWVGADNYNEKYSVKSSGEVLTMFKSVLEYLDPIDEEIYTEEEISHIISTNNHPRRNPEGLEEYWKALKPYTPPVEETPVIPVAPIIYPVDPTQIPVP
jgi:membrane peptidoglycan carboxypeptidase